MKARGAAIQGALAAAGLVAAYLTWQRPAEDKDAEVIVLDASRSEIKRIRYEDERRVVELDPGKDVTWIRSTEKPPPPPKPKPSGPDGGVSDGGSAGDAGTLPDAGASLGFAGPPDGGSPDAGPPPAPVAADAPPPMPREYRANESAAKAIEKFAPLRAVRGLGTLPKEKLEELGLSDSSRTLEVVTSSGAHRFRLGADPVGAATTYAMSEPDGRVYVIRGAVVSDLQFAANRLVDRRLHAFGDDDYDAVIVRAEGQERRLVKAGDRLADSATSPPDEFASNWHDRLWRLMGVEVLGRGETPAAGEPKVELRVEYLKAERPVGFVEVGRAGTDVFARTEHTAGWVRLAGGTTAVLDERRKVLEPRG